MAVKKNSDTILSALNESVVNIADGAFFKKFEKENFFSLTGKEKVSSADDVAFIFRALKDVSVENAFAVLVKDKVPTVVHIATGDINHASFNIIDILLPANRLEADEIYFVHNHPGGNVEPSEADKNTISALREAAANTFGDRKVPVHAVIVDGYKNIYSVMMDGEGFGEIEEKPEKAENGREKQIDIYKGHPDVFNENYEISEKLLSPFDTANLVNSMRLGKKNSLCALVMSGGKAVGNFCLPFHDASGHEKEIARLVSQASSQLCGTETIIFGNSNLIWHAEQIQKEIAKITNNGLVLLDVMHISDTGYISAVEHGAIEQQKETLLEVAEINEPEEVKDTDDIDVEEYKFKPVTLPNGVIDYTGIEHDKIYLANRKDILTKPRPDWIPELNEGGLKDIQWLPHCMKAEDGSYYVSAPQKAVQVYPEGVYPDGTTPPHIQKQVETFEKEMGMSLKEYCERYNHEYVTVIPKTVYKMSLDVLTATVDYYMKRERERNKAAGIKKPVMLPRKTRSMSGERYSSMRELMAYMPEFDDKPDLREVYKWKSKSEGFSKQNRIIFGQYNELNEKLQGKKIDLNLQKQDYIDTHRKGEETSYGDKNLDASLFEEFGVMVKKQNGTAITDKEKESIRADLEKVSAFYGGMKETAEGYGLKISYADNVNQHARKAVGLFNPAYRAIGVSYFKEQEGRENSGIIMAHETAHWLDSMKGHETHNYFASDRAGTLENKIAENFKSLFKKRNKNNPLGKYWNRTCECFARAEEEAFAIENGLEEGLVNNRAYLPKDVFMKEIMPLIKELNELNREHFSLAETVSRDTDMDEIKAAASITDTSKEENKSDIYTDKEFRTHIIDELLKVDPSFFTLTHFIAHEVCTGQLSSLDKRLGFTSKKNEALDFIRKGVDEYYLDEFDLYRRNEEWSRLETHLKYVFILSDEMKRGYVELYTDIPNTEYLSTKEMLLEELEYTFSMGTSRPLDYEKMAKEFLDSAEKSYMEKKNIEITQREESNMSEKKYPGLSDEEAKRYTELTEKEWAALGYDERIEVRNLEKTIRNNTPFTKIGSKGGVVSSVDEALKVVRDIAEKYGTGKEGADRLFDFMAYNIKGESDESLYNEVHKALGLGEHENSYSRALKKVIGKGTAKDDELTRQENMTADFADEIDDRINEGEISGPVKIDMGDFKNLYEDTYEKLYASESDNTADAKRFDEFLKTHQDFVSEFNNMSQDIISSDREAAAFAMTLENLTGKKLEEIGEVEFSGTTAQLEDKTLFKNFRETMEKIKQEQEDPAHQALMKEREILAAEIKDRWLKMPLAEVKSQIMSELPGDCKLAMINHCNLSRESELLENIVDFMKEEYLTSLEKDKNMSAEDKKLIQDVRNAADRYWAEGGKQKFDALAKELEAKWMQMSKDDIAEQIKRNFTNDQIDRLLNFRMESSTRRTLNEYNFYNTWTDEHPKGVMDSMREERRKRSLYEELSKAESDEAAKNIIKRFSDEDIEGYTELMERNSYTEEDYKNIGVDVQKANIGLVLEAREQRAVENRKKDERNKADTERLMNLYGDEKKAKKAVENIQIEDFVSEEKNRLFLQGIYREGGYEVATDGKMLVAMKKNYPADLEKKIIGVKKEYKDIQIDGMYPNWKKIDVEEKPEWNRTAEIGSIDELIKRCMVAAAIGEKDDENKNLKGHNVAVRVGKAWLLADRLLPVLCFAKKNNLTEIYQEPNGDILHDENGDLMKDENGKYVKEYNEEKDRVGIIKFTDGKENYVAYCTANINEKTILFDENGVLRNYEENADVLKALMGTGKEYALNFAKTALKPFETMGEIAWNNLTESNFDISYDNIEEKKSDGKFPSTKSEKEMFAAYETIAKGLFFSLSQKRLELAYNKHAAEDFIVPFVADLESSPFMKKMYKDPEEILFYTKTDNPWAKNKIERFCESYIEARKRDGVLVEDIRQKLGRAVFRNSGFERESLMLNENSALMTCGNVNNLPDCFIDVYCYKDDDNLAKKLKMKKLYEANAIIEDEVKKYSFILNEKGKIIKFRLNDGLLEDKEYTDVSEISDEMEKEYPGIKSTAERAEKVAEALIKSEKIRENNPGISNRDVNEMLLKEYSELEKMVAEEKSAEAPSIEDVETAFRIDSKRGENEKVISELIEGGFVTKESLEKIGRLKISAGILDHSEFTRAELLAKSLEAAKEDLSTEKKSDALLHALVENDVLESYPMTKLEDVRKADFDHLVDVILEENASMSEIKATKEAMPLIKLASENNTAGVKEYMKYDRSYLEPSDIYRIADFSKNNETILAIKEVAGEKMRKFCGDRYKLRELLDITPEELDQKLKGMIRNRHSEDDYFDGKVSNESSAQYYIPDPMKDYVITNGETITFIFSKDSRGISDKVIGIRSTFGVKKEVGKDNAIILESTKHKEKLLREKGKSYVRLEYSERSDSRGINFENYEEGQIYDVKEFNEAIMALDKKAFENHDGYYKSRFVLCNVPNTADAVSDSGTIPTGKIEYYENPVRTPFVDFRTDRYDIGDGNGSIFAFFKRYIQDNQAAIESLENLEDKIYFPDVSITDRLGIKKLAASVNTDRIAEARNEFAKAFIENRDKQNGQWMVDANEVAPYEKAVEDAKTNLKIAYEHYTKDLTELMTEINGHKFSGLSEQHKAYILETLGRQTALLFQPETTDYANVEGDSDYWTLWRKDRWEISQLPADAEMKEFWEKKITEQENLETLVEKTNNLKFAKPGKDATTWETTKNLEYDNKEWDFKFDENGNLISAKIYALNAEAEILTGEEFQKKYSDMHEIVTLAFKDKELIENLKSEDTLAAENILEEFKSKTPAEIALEKALVFGSGNESHLERKVRAQEMWRRIDAVWKNNDTEEIKSVTGLINGLYASKNKARREEYDPRNASSVFAEWLRLETLIGAFEQDFADMSGTIVFGDKAVTVTYNANVMLEPEKHGEKSVSTDFTWEEVAEKTASLIERNIYISPIEEKRATAISVAEENKKGDISEKIEILKNPLAENARERVYKFFLENHTMDEKTEFIKNTYGLGCRETDYYIETHDMHGITVSTKNLEPVITWISWNDAAEITNELIKKGEYLTKEEIAVLEEKEPGLNVSDLVTAKETLKELRRKLLTGELAANGHTLANDEYMGIKWKKIEQSLDALAEKIPTNTDELRSLDTAFRNEAVARIKDDLEGMADALTARIDTYLSRAESHGLEVTAQMLAVRSFIAGTDLAKMAEKEINGEASRKKEVIDRIEKINYGYTRAQAEEEYENTILVHGLTSAMTLLDTQYNAYKNEKGNPGLQDAKLTLWRFADTVRRDEWQKNHEVLQNDKFLTTKLEKLEKSLRALAEAIPSKSLSDDFNRDFALDREIAAKIAENINSLTGDVFNRIRDYDNFCQSRNIEGTDTLNRLIKYNSEKISEVDKIIENMAKEFKEGIEQGGNTMEKTFTNGINSVAEFNEYTGLSYTEDEFIKRFGPENWTAEDLARETEAREHMLTNAICETILDKINREASAEAVDMTVSFADDLAGKIRSGFESHTFSEAVELVSAAQEEYEKEYPAEEQYKFSGTRIGNPLTGEEAAVVEKLAEVTKMDGWFALDGENYPYDVENECYIDAKEILADFKNGVEADINLNFKNLSTEEKQTWLSLVSRLQEENSNENMISMVSKNIQLAAWEKDGTRRIYVNGATGYKQDKIYLAKKKDGTWGVYYPKDASISVTAKSFIKRGIIAGAVEKQIPNAREMTFDRLFEKATGAKEEKKKQDALGDIKDIRFQSDELEIRGNYSKQGFEVKFLGEEDKTVVEKLTELGFKYSKKQEMYYIKNSDEAREFIDKLVTEKEIERDQKYTHTIEERYLDMLRRNMNLTEENKTLKEQNEELQEKLKEANGFAFSHFNRVFGTEIKDAGELKIVAIELVNSNPMKYKDDIEAQAKFVAEQELTGYCLSNMGKEKLTGGEKKAISQYVDNLFKNGIEKADDYQKVTAELAKTLSEKEKNMPGGIIKESTGKDGAVKIYGDIGTSGEGLNKFVEYLNAEAGKKNENMSIYSVSIATDEAAKKIVGALKSGGVKIDIKEIMPNNGERVLEMTASGSGIMDAVSKETVENVPELLTVANIVCTQDDKLFKEAYKETGFVQKAYESGKSYDEVRFETAIESIDKIMPFCDEDPTLKRKLQAIRTTFASTEQNISTSLKTGFAIRIPTPQERELTRILDAELGTLVNEKSTDIKTVRERVMVYDTQNKIAELKAKAVSSSPSFDWQKEMDEIINQHKPTKLQIPVTQKNTDYGRGRDD